MSKLYYKYIIVDGGPILFSDKVSHLQVGEGFLKSKATIYSAGFCCIEFIEDEEVPKVICSGRSDSLNIESHSQNDAIVITDFFKQLSAVKYHLLVIKDLYGK
jgi:hypothetical protein